MCGIIGVVGPRQMTREGFVKARESLHHRGPDDEGLFDEPEILLGFRRLSILDLSPTGAQPMTSACGRFVIVFNGEVYNFRELRTALEEEGHRFRSTGDTEVVLELFAREGERCLPRLRGMFAFAVWDRLEKALFLARDRFGIKPLYVWRRPNGLSFASEVRALRALPGGPAQISRRAVEGYLYWGSVPEPLTILEGVEALPPASWLRWRSGECAAGRYWHFPAGEPRYRTRDEVLEDLRPALLEAVRIHCISDAPLGAFLSGGIDSSAVVSLMRAAGQSKIHTFSISFPGTAFDEAVYAREVATDLETTHENIEVGEEMVRGLLDDFFASMDQPTMDGVNTWLVSKLSRQAGLTVALSGLGGDELFAGYSTHVRVAAVTRWISSIPAPAVNLAARAVSTLPAHRARKLEALSIRATPFEKGYFLSRGLFMPSEVRKFLGHGTDHGESTIPFPNGESLPSADLHRTLATELRAYTLNQLLRDSDVFGMANSQEIRVPLLDHVVAEIAFTAPADAVISIGQKALLRDALPKPLPRRCTHRPKMGFTFPFETWMAGPWLDSISGTLRDPSTRVSSRLLKPAALQAELAAFLGGRSGWSRTWALASILQWSERCGASAG